MLGLSVGHLSDTYCLVLIIDDDATGTMGEDKCNGQLKMLKKCKKHPLIATRRADTIVATKNCVCLQPDAVKETENQ